MKWKDELFRYTRGNETWLFSDHAENIDIAALLDNTDTSPLNPFFEWKYGGI